METADAKGHGDASSADRPNTDAVPRGDDGPGAISYWVTLLGGVVFENFAGALAPFGISAVQYLILYMCYQQNLKTVADITSLVPHDASTISRNVENLRSKELLVTYRAKPDRRVLQLALTEEGRSLMAELVKAARTVEQEITQGISEAEKRNAVQAMRKMVMGSRQ